MFFSIVIPLYNRPDEIRELLKSLTKQTYTDFEVIIVEDGSTKDAKVIVDSFKDQLDIYYYFKPNAGQGFARNYGFERAKGDFFIVFDSDVIVPKGYLAAVKLSIEVNAWDAFGGPDAAHESFTPMQKAISYSMTSPFTTGGIRGNKKHVGKFHPRSFNMGISAKVFQDTKGYKLSRRSEDIEFSIRMINNGYKVGLIPDAFVYHKRRTSLALFYKQIFSFGKGRIDIGQMYPGELKLVHALPAVFTVGFFTLLILNLMNILVLDQIAILHSLVIMGNTFLLLYTVFLFIHSLLNTKSLHVAVLSIATAYTQLLAYGMGFIRNYVDVALLKRDTKQ